MCKVTQNFAPKIHSLLRLSEKAELKKSEDNKDLLADMNKFNIAGCYAESLYPALSKTNASKHFLIKRKKNKMFLHYGKLSDMPIIVLNQTLLA